MNKQLAESKITANRYTGLSSKLHLREDFKTQKTSLAPRLNCKSYEKQTLLEFACLSFTLTSPLPADQSATRPSITCLQPRALRGAYQNNNSHKGGSPGVCSKINTAFFKRSSEYCKYMPGKKILT